MALWTLASAGVAQTPSGVLCLPTAKTENRSSMFRGHVEVPGIDGGLFESKGTAQFWVTDRSSRASWRVTCLVTDCVSYGPKPPVVSSQGYQGRESGA